MLEVYPFSVCSHIDRSRKRSTDRISKDPSGLFCMYTHPSLAQGKGGRGSLPLGARVLPVALGPAAPLRSQIHSRRDFCWTGPAVAGAAAGELGAGREWEGSSVLWTLALKKRQVTTRRGCSRSRILRSAGEKVRRCFYAFFTLLPACLSVLCLCLSASMAAWWPVCLALCLSTFLSSCLPVRLPVAQLMSVCLSVCLPFSPSDHLSANLSVNWSICPSFCPSVCLYDVHVCLSVHLSILYMYLSLYHLSVCLCVSMYLSIRLFVYPSTCLCVSVLSFRYLNIYLHVCPCVCLPSSLISTSIYPSVGGSVCSFICLYAYLLVYLSITVSIFCQSVSLSLCLSVYLPTCL